MFKKLLLMAICMPFILACAKAQTGTHSLGASVPMGLTNYGVRGSGYDAYYLAQFSYGYRKNLSETDNSSFSIGTITSAGAGIYSDGFGSGVVYRGDIQFWGDFNKGMGAVPEPAKNSGFHVGAGFGISYAGADGEAIDNDNGVSYGPMGRVGYRFGLYSNRKDVYKAFGVSLFYKYGLESSRWRTIGFHLLADL